MFLPRPTFNYSTKKELTKQQIISFHDSAKRDFLKFVNCLNVKPSKGLSILKLSTVLHIIWGLVARLVT